MGRPWASGTSRFDALPFVAVSSDSENWVVATSSGLIMRCSTIRLLHCWIVGLAKHCCLDFLPLAAGASLFWRLCHRTVASSRLRLISWSRSSRRSRTARPSLTTGSLRCQIHCRIVFSLRHRNSAASLAVSSDRSPGIDWPPICRDHFPCIMTYRLLWIAPEVFAQTTPAPISGNLGTGAHLEIKGGLAVVMQVGRKVGLVMSSALAEPSGSVADTPSDARI